MTDIPNNPPAYTYDPATQRYTATPETLARLRAEPVEPPTDDIPGLKRLGATPVPATGGRKNDAGKPPLSLIPRAALEAEAAVMGHGAKKYDSDQWRNGFAYRRLIDAAMRHLLAISDGEDRDPESGELHAAHVRCNMAFLIEQITYGTGTDDRFKRSMATEPEKHLGERVKELRGELGLSAFDLGRRLLISEGAVLAFEMTPTHAGLTHSAKSQLEAWIGTAEKYLDAQRKNADKEAPV